MDFEYLQSIDISDLRRYVIAHRLGKFDQYMYSKYVAKENAETNGKVLKLLNLTII